MNLGKYKNLLSKGDLRDISLLENIKSQSKGQSIDLVKPFILFPIQEKWVQWAFMGGERLLLGARGYGKTETIVFFGLFNEIISNPKITSRIYTRNYEDAKDLLRVLGNMLQDYGKKGKFTETQIQLEENRRSKEPTVSLKSIMGKGHKGKHVDWIIFDDPVDLMDEFSPTLVIRTKKIYENLSSVAKKGVIIVGQPVTENDLYGFLRATLEKEQVREYWHGTIDQLDTNLDVLRRTKTERFIQANYFGNIIPDSTRPFSGIEVADFKLTGYTTAFIDPAYGGEDYTAITIGQVTYNEIGKKKYLVHIYQERKHISECIEILLKLCMNFKVGKIMIEKTGDHGMSTDLLKKRAYEIGYSVLIDDFSPRRNKKERILSSIGINIDNIIIHSSSDCINEIHTWNPLSKHDDHVDSLASFILANH